MNTDKLLLLLKRQIDKIKSLQNPNFWQQPEFRNFDWNSDDSYRQNEYLKRLILSGKPFFIGRYGTVELNYFDLYGWISLMSQLIIINRALYVNKQQEGKICAIT